MPTQRGGIVKMCVATGLSLQVDIVSVSLSNVGPASQRLLAFTDKNHDLFLTPVRDLSPAKTVCLGELTIIVIARVLFRLKQWLQLFVSTIFLAIFATGGKNAKLSTHSYLINNIMCHEIYYNTLKNCQLKNCSLKVRLQI